METHTYLAYAAEYLRELEVTARLDPADAEYPVDMLVLPLEELVEIYPEETAALAICFAGRDAAFSEELGIKLLYLTAYLGRAERGRDALRAYFSHINPRLPLGCFAVDEEENFYYRYQLPILEGMEVEAFIRQFGTTFAIIHALLHLFLHRVYDIKEGRISAEEAAGLMAADLEQVQRAIQESEAAGERAGKE